MKKKILSLLLLLAITIIPTNVYADAVVGDSIVSLGADLTEERKQAMLEEFDAPDGVEIIYTTNAEEHEYLGGSIPPAQIGTRALSSVMITFTEAGSGLHVETSDKINYITEENYTNALITAGVENADIKVSAPVEVSGTAALTGIMKAYEVTTGEPIDEDVKKVANEEMVTSAELGEEVGDETATEIITEIKQEIAEKAPQTTEEVRDIVVNVINNFNITISDELVDRLVALFDQMKDANIDWDKVSNQLEEFSGQVSDYLSSEEGQGFLESLKSWINQFIDWISSLFR